MPKLAGYGRRPYPARMRRNGFPSNRFGTVENRKRRPALPVGVSRDARNIPSRNSAARVAPGIKKHFCPLLGLWPKEGGRTRTRARDAQSCFAARPCRRFVDDLAADESAASFCLMPGSQPECLRHSRGKKSLAGQKDGRHFAAGRENGIFPAKSAFASPVCSRQAKLPVGNFDAAAWGKQKSPGWPASGFRVLSKRVIYGTFCLGSIWWRPAGPRRECYRSTGSARPKQAAGKRRTAGVYGPAA